MTQLINTNTTLVYFHHALGKRFHYKNFWGLQMSFQITIYFRHPLTHKIIQHKHVYSLTLFQYSFIH